MYGVPVYEITQQKPRMKTESFCDDITIVFLFCTRFVQVRTSTSSICASIKIRYTSKTFSSDHTNHKINSRRTFQKLKIKMKQRQQQQQQLTTNSSLPFLAFVWLLSFSSLTQIVVGWSSSPFRIKQQQQQLQTVTTPPISATTTSKNDRREFVTSLIAIGTVPFLLPTTSVQAAAATISKQDILNDLTISKEKIATIPALLEEKEWDKVRSILKVPPVNKLWNLGDSQNIVSQLAKETGNIDLFEIKEELAYNLQICDQLTYNNAFVYYQPGNGKFKIKEPQQLAVMAVNQIQQIIDLVNE